MPNEKKDISVEDDDFRPWRNRGRFVRLRDTVMHSLLILFIYTAWVYGCHLASNYFPDHWPLFAIILLLIIIKPLTHGVLSIIKALGVGLAPLRIISYIFGNQLPSGSHLLLIALLNLGYLILAVILFPTLQKSIPGLPWVDPSFMIRVLLSYYLLLATYGTVKMTRGYFSLRAGWFHPNIKKIDTAISPTKSPKSIRIAHWTDLHLTKDSNTKLLDGKKSSPNLVFEKLIDRYKQELMEIDVIVVSGDITDQGLQSEWEFFEKCIPPQLTKKLVLVPGNHDLNIPMDAMHGQSLDDWSRVRRKMTTLMMLVMVQGERSLLFDGEGFITLDSFVEKYQSDFFAFNECLQASQQRPMNMNDLKVLNDVDAITSFEYPLVVRVNGSTPIDAVVFNSVAYGTNILSNAFGSLGWEQMATFRNKIMKDPEREKTPCVLAAHHHVGMPRERFSLKSYMVRGLSIIDGGYLLGLMNQSKKGMPFFNGHRHVAYHAAVGAHAIISGASTTLGVDADIDQLKGLDEFSPKWNKIVGDGNPSGPHFGVYDISYDPDKGSTVVNSCECWTY